MVGFNYTWLFNAAIFFGDITIRQGAKAQPSIEKANSQTGRTGVLHFILGARMPFGGVSGNISGGAFQVASTPDPYCGVEVSLFK